MNKKLTKILLDGIKTIDEYKLEYEHLFKEANLLNEKEKEKTLEECDRFHDLVVRLSEILILLALLKGEENVKKDKDV